MIGKLVIGAVVAAIGIQFIPYGKTYTNPPIISEPTWDSPRTKELFNNACANCHSNQTFQLFRHTHLYQHHHVNQLT